MVVECPPHSQRHTAALISGTKLTNINVEYLETEKLLLERLIEVVRDLDPDILIGYEVRKIAI